VEDKRLRLLILGAHPDDAEYHAGGLASVYCQAGHVVKMVSLTDGSAGHHEKPRAELAAVRREEAGAAARVLGATCEVWDLPDGELMPTLEVRRRVIWTIRTFGPDLVLTHRPYDYHPDHRAVGQAVQDASFLVRVPHLVPEAAPLRADPVVAYLPDLFTRPCPMVADVVLDIGEHVERIVAMLACHGSQVFEWLPYLDGTTDRVPQDATERQAWLRQWYAACIRSRAERFRQELIAAYGEAHGRAIELAEFYEISQYGAQPDRQALQRLFPQCHVVASLPDAK